MAYIYNSENGVVKVSEILLLLSFQLGFQQSYQQLSTCKKQLQDVEKSAPKNKKTGGFQPPVRSDPHVILEGGVPNKEGTGLYVLDVK